MPEADAAPIDPAEPRYFLLHARGNPDAVYGLVRLTTTPEPMTAYWDGGTWVDDPADLPLVTGEHLTEATEIIEITDDEPEFTDA